MARQVRTFCNLPPALHAQLVAESKRTGAPLTEIVRRALMAYLENKQ